MMDEVAAKDFVFRYELPSGGNKEPVYQERLVEMLREQLASILNLVIPMQGTTEVKVDGFKLLRDSETVYKIFTSSVKEHSPYQPREGSQDINNAALYEPRIDFIKRQLASLLSVVSLERDNKVIEPDGFRLKDLKDWQVPAAGDPAEVFGYAAARCDARCVFCYAQGNPAAMPFSNLQRSPEEEFEEIKTRLKYYSPRANLSLFPTLGNLYEVLAHPYAVETLRLLREKTDKVFRIVTNGLSLTPETIAALAKLQPVYLYISLNSASPERHRKLMRTRKSDTVLNALPRLREKGIPYAVVIVPWVFDSLQATLDDLVSTIGYCEPYQPHLIQINLPGYTQYFSDKKLFDRDEVWSAVVAQVREIRQTCAIPIIAMPTMYEENSYYDRKNEPRIIGMVKNSPAARAGLNIGDRITEINGLPVSSRPQARDLLSSLRDSNLKEILFVVERDGRLLRLTANLDDFTYPYSPDIDPHLGVIFLGMGFRVSCVEKLKAIIDSHQARRVLLLSSTLVRPVLEQCLRESHLLGASGLRLDIAVPPNRFLGGNIFMGDLLVVQDFIDCIKEYLARGNQKPDLIIIPSSPFHLGRWKRDLTGRVYLDIEREVGIPVALLENEPIYD
jgi:wyosine [tRNA(Phe)-imidazoG37] synthetase (radical SAM superfamily)